MGKSHPSPLGALGLGEYTIAIPSATIGSPNEGRLP